MTPPPLAPGTPVLVTGAGGFVGVNLCRALAGAGARVHGTVRPGGNSWRLEALEQAAAVHPVDLADAPAVTRLVTTAEPEIVFHAAVRSAYDRSAGLGPWVADGVLSLAHVLDAAAAAGTRRVVLLGSFLVYAPGGPDGDGLHREEDPLRPACLRGAVKAASSLVGFAGARVLDLPLVELRLFSVYGPWEPLHRLVPRAIRAALRGEELPLTGPGLRRDLVHVDDVVAACLRAATAPGVAGRTLPVGSGREVANEEVVQEVERIVGARIHTRPGAHPPRATDVSRCRADLSGARELLGWEPRYSLREGLAATVPWVAEHLERDTA